MSGLKRTIEDKDPDYEDISVVHQNKRHKAIESSARDAAISKIEAIVKDQFAVELKNKEHEIEIIDQRLNEARRMMDKLRAYIVANYYASAGFSKGQEASAACDPTILNHPSIKKFLESPSRASSPANHRSDTSSVNNSETDSVCAHNDLLDKDSHISSKTVQRATSITDEKLSKDSASNENIETTSSDFIRSEDTSRRFVKKTIVVGNVSKYIPPDKREENDQSTHKWMVYVRGSRREPSINHFVKKVWFFLHPSYKPNDLVEVREPPFHLTRRGWGEFPVRVQIHFKDSQNKRVDIIHNLKLDRTYTGLQTLGAETVVEVELHRHSLAEDFLCSQSSNESSQSEGCPPGPNIAKLSSPVKGGQELTEKGFSVASEPAFHTQPSSLERTPTKTTQRFTIGAHGSTAFQPITTSCKIVPQGQAASLAESPGKSFQPITMSCKIVSGSPTSKHSSILQTGTRSPLPKVHGGSLITPNIKQEESIFAAMPPLCPIGSHSKSQSPKAMAGGLGAFTKVIIKQEPVETSQQQPETPSTSQPSVQQIVTMKSNQMISVSPQKNINTTEGSKVVGIPVGSTVQSSVKPSVTISGGQILVTKSSSSVAKVVGTKQMVAQGVAKAVVSSGSASVMPQTTQNLTKAQVTSAITTKSGSQGSVMATLQLPSTNLGNLANLPPGTKLYLTTNSKSTSGKGKLLLIPQGAILRAASTANLQSGVSTSGGSGSASTATGLPQHLTYTSYILKQTPQGTFLVGQPSPQTSGKQASSNTVVQGSTGTSAQGQQILKVSAGQKGAIITQANSSSSGLVKISENVLKSLPATSQTQKPGTTLLRVAGGVITTASTSLPSVSANGTAQQVTEGTISSVSSIVSSSKVHVQPSSATTGSNLKSLGSSKSSPALTTRATLSPSPSTTALTVKADPDHSNNMSFHSVIPAVKVEENVDVESSSVKTEHLQNFKQLLTATVKKVPLIGEKDEDCSNPFCASTLEQHYSWNIGKRRAAEWQRAVVMKKMLQEIIAKQPKFSNVTQLKTKEIMHWCRIHGYTPPDPENASDDRESIEDVLTRIDNEAALPSSYSSSEVLCRKVEELEKILKKEKEVDEEVDILSTEEEQKPQIKKENEEGEEVKFYLTPSLSCEFVRDTAQEIGVSLQPIEVHKNVYASPVEEMILKATEQFVSDLLRDALAVGYQMTSSKRAPREITIANIHQAICNIPIFDFLTNRHMGALNVEDELALKQNITPP